MVVDSLQSKYGERGYNFTFIASQLAKDTGLPPQCIGKALKEEINNGGPVEYFSKLTSRVRYQTVFGEVR